MATINITDETFQSDVLDSSLPVLVDFWADWCAPCRALGPTLEAVAEEWEGRVVIAKLNVEENPKAAETYEIKSLPTMLLFINGQAAYGLRGGIPKESFADFFDQCRVS